MERNLYLDKLIRRKNNGMIKVITGIRRSGKTYLLFELFYDYLIKSGVDNMSVNYLGEGVCSCGKTHICKLKNVISGKGVISSLSDEAKKLGMNKIFIIADENTYSVAGDKTAEILEKSGIPYSKYIFGSERIEPDENAVGSVVMHFDRSCDGMVAIGSGVINDISKILADVTKLPYIIVATKTDKLNKTERKKAVETLMSNPVLREGTTIILYSSETREGKDDVWNEILGYAER